VDIVRCAIAFDDPYAMAVMVAFLMKEFDVVRVKNRFEKDVVEEVSAERLQAEFYAAEMLGDDTDSTNESGAKSENFYRDVLVNLRPAGSDFICEVQLTFTGISILKKSEQKIYTLRRMKSAEELLDTFVFSEDPNDFRRRGPPLPTGFPLGRSASFGSSSSDLVQPFASAPARENQEDQTATVEKTSDRGQVADTNTGIRMQLPFAVEPLSPQSARSNGKAEKGAWTGIMPSMEASWVTRSSASADRRHAKEEELEPLSPASRQ
jgi:hypothetical protein